ncbi:hypothetical protein ACRALDRAFT_2024036 [Sodiomyces alcalophilus JCM 7366]|uniref:uncharacterized protein n=1 Tax=Sodiomyces alcalophilus JCM 7366 TaxID=591952 RepID=UPI0039B6A0B6
MATKAPSGGWFTPDRLEQLDAIERKYQLISATQTEEYTQAKDKLLAAAAEEARRLVNRSDIPKDIVQKLRQLMAGNLDLRLQVLKHDYEKKTADCDKEKKDAERRYLRQLFQEPPKEESKSSLSSAVTPGNTRSETSAKDKDLVPQQPTPRDDDSGKVQPRPAPVTATPKPGPSSSLVTPNLSNPARSSTHPKVFNGAGTVSAKKSSVRRTLVSLHPRSSLSGPVATQPTTHVPAQKAARAASVSAQPPVQTAKTPKRKSTAALESGVQESGRAKRPKTTSSNNPQDDRTVTYDEVYRNGNAKYKHAIISWDGKWYILKCEEHGVHFRMSALAAAAKHLDSAAHGYLGRQQDQALRLLGYRVLDCDEERANRHNKLVREAFDNGYRPLGSEHKSRCKQLRKQSMSTPGGAALRAMSLPPDRGPNTIPGTGSFQGRATTPAPSVHAPIGATPSRLTQKHPNKHTSKNLGIITNPRPGAIYFATPKPKAGDKPRKYIVMILAWKDLTPCGYRGTTLGNLPLLQDARRQPCYTYDQDGITGWAPGYEDGGKSVKNRWFPVLWFERKNTREGWVRATELSTFPMYPVRNLGPDHPETRARTQHELGRRLMRRREAKDDAETASAMDLDPDATDCDSDSNAGEADADADADAAPLPVDDEKDMDYEYEELDSSGDASSEDVLNRDITPPPTNFIDLTATSSRIGAAAGTRSSTKTASRRASSRAPQTQPHPQPSPSVDRARKRKEPRSALTDSRPEPAEKPSGNGLSSLAHGREEGSGLFVEAERPGTPEGGKEDKEEDDQEAVAVRLGTPDPLVVAEEEGRARNERGASQEEEGDEASKPPETQQKMPEKMTVEHAMASSAVAGAPAARERETETENLANDAGQGAKEREKETEHQANDAGKTDKEKEEPENLARDAGQAAKEREKETENLATANEKEKEKDKEKEPEHHPTQKHQPQPNPPPSNQPDQNSQSQKHTANGDGSVRPGQIHGADHSGPSAEAERRDSRQRFLSDLARHSLETSRGESVSVDTSVSGSQQKNAMGRPSLPPTPNGGNLLNRRHSDWTPSSGWAGNLGELARRAVRSSDTPPESPYSPGISTPRGQSPFAVKSEPDAFDLCSFRQGDRQWKAGSAAEAVRLRMDEIAGVARAKEGTPEEIMVDPRRVQRFQYNRSKDRSQHELVLYYGERPGGRAASHAGDWPGTVQDAGASVREVVAGRESSGGAAARGDAGLRVPGRESR